MGFPYLFKIWMILIYPMSDRLDLLGQYISQVLIPRLNYCDSLFKERRYHEALIAQKSVIRALVRVKVEDEGILRDWIKRIDDVSDEMKNERAMTKTMTLWRQHRKGDTISEALYQEIDFEIWGKLHELGYFKLGSAYGPDLREIDLKDAETQ